MFISLPQFGDVSLLPEVISRVFDITDPQRLVWVCSQAQVFLVVEEINGARASGSVLGASEEAGLPEG